MTEILFARQKPELKIAELLEEHAQDQSPARIEELVSIFIRSTEMEVQFWNIGAHAMPDD